MKNISADILSLVLSQNRWQRCKPPVRPDLSVWQGGNISLRASITCRLSKVASEGGIETYVVGDIGYSTDFSQALKGKMS